MPHFRSLVVVGKLASVASLQQALEQVGSLRSLAQTLADDPRSTKAGAEVWRGQLQLWKRGGGISRENAVILHDYLDFDDDEVVRQRAEEVLESIAAATRDLVDALGQLRPLLQAQSAVVGELREIATELRRREAAS